MNYWQVYRRLKQLGSPSVLSKHLLDDETFQEYLAAAEEYLILRRKSNHSEFRYDENVLEILVAYRKDDYVKMDRLLSIHKLRTDKFQKLFEEGIERQVATTKLPMKIRTQQTVKETKEKKRSRLNPDCSMLLGRHVQSNSISDCYRRAWKLRTIFPPGTRKITRPDGEFAILPLRPGESQPKIVRMSFTKVPEDAEPKKPGPLAQDINRSETAKKVVAPAWCGPKRGTRRKAEPAQEVVLDPGQKIDEIIDEVVKNFCESRVGASAERVQKTSKQSTVVEHLEDEARVETSNGTKRKRIVSRCMETVAKRRCSQHYDQVASEDNGAHIVVDPVEPLIEEVQDERAAAPLNDEILCSPNKLLARAQPVLSDELIVRIAFDLAQVIPEMALIENDVAPIDVPTNSTSPERNVDALEPVEETVEEPMEEGLDRSVLHPVEAFKARREPSLPVPLEFEEGLLEVITIEDDDETAGPQIVVPTSSESREGTVEAIFEVGRNVEPKQVENQRNHHIEQPIDHQDNQLGPYQLPDNVDWSLPPGGTMDFTKWTVAQMAHWVLDVTTSLKSRQIIEGEEMDGKSMQDLLNPAFRHEIKLGFGPWRKLEKAARIMVDYAETH